MQKKIIALAIASALTVPAMAHAAATVYGQANLSYDRVNDGAATSSTQNKLTSNNSRVGLKGSEDLGGGLTAVWQMEGTVGQDVGNATATSLFNRNTFLGLKSAELGSVLLGNYDTPYKVAFRKLDVFADSVVADNRTNIFLMDARRKNSFNLISNTMSGFTVAFASEFGAEGADSTVKKGKATSLSGTYEQGPIYAALAIDNLKVGSATGDLSTATLNAANYLGNNSWQAGDKISAKKLGGGYTMNQFAVNAIVEKFTATIVGLGEVTGTNMYVGGKYNISGTDAVKAAYGKFGETKMGGSKNTDSVKQATVGYDHSMSKATTVYALYTKVTAQASANPNGNDPSTLSLGVKHAF